MSMKNLFDFKRLFSQKGIGFYLECAASVLALAVVIVGSVLGGLSNNTPFDIAISVYFIVGIVVTVLSLWLNFDFMALPPAILFAVGFGVIAYNGAPSIMDMINNIHFQGGNAELIIVYLALSLCAVVLCVVACFLGTKSKKAD